MKTLIISISLFTLMLTGCAKKPAVIPVTPMPTVESAPEPEAEPFEEPVMEPEPSPAPKWFPSVIYFEFDSYFLSDTEAGKLKDAQLEGNCIIEGYTCPIGTEEYNMSLAEKRAVTVSNWLENIGLEKNWDIISYGEENPKTTVRDMYHLNRRVVIRCE